MRSRLLVLAVLVLSQGACAPGGANIEASLGGVAESYVRLVLALGEHDAGYVDAYYGPPQWRDEAKVKTQSLDAIRRAAAALSDRLAAIDSQSGDEMLQLRHRYLSQQLIALTAYADILGGKVMSFDEESKALYDAVAPTHDASFFRDAIEELGRLLPGDGTVAERLAAFRAQYVIAPDRLDAVFTAAIDECRKRTLERMELPAGEDFRVEYVNDKPWSAYNWYQGDGQSLIQVNTDLPIYIDRAIDLACHEGYPGHHVYNALLEKNLARGRGWVEFTVYPLYSPQSLIAEGSANYGIEVTFPGDERVTFERDVLFPIAGLDPSTATRYYEVGEVLEKFEYAGNEAARMYLNGDLSREETIAWLTANAVSSPERAAQSVRFYDAYRSYVINYNLGQDMVRNYVVALGGTDDQPDRRWELFMQLLSSPRLPSGLEVASD